MKASPVKRRNEQSLAEAIGHLVDGAGMRERLDEAAIAEAWPEVAGAMVARHTTALRLRSTVLRISVDSAPLRQELNYLRAEILARINERAGRQVVKEVVVQ